MSSACDSGLVTSSLAAKVEFFLNFSGSSFELTNETGVLVSTGVTVVIESSDDTDIISDLIVASSGKYVVVEGAPFMKVSRLPIG